VSSERERMSSISVRGSPPPLIDRNAADEDPIVYEYR